MAHRIIPPRTYYLIFALLLLLLAATVGVSYVDLGWANIPVTLGIAFAKMALIMLFFMHVWYMSPLVRMFAVAGFVWLGIGAVFTFADYLTRDWRSERSVGSETEYRGPAIDRVDPRIAPGPERGLHVEPPAQTHPRSSGE